jgi:hypothetical protein
MPEYANTPIILGRPFLRTIKALINLHERNVGIDLPSQEPFVVHFPRKKKARKNDDGIITLKPTTLEWELHSKSPNEHKRWSS